MKEETPNRLVLETNPNCRKAPVVRYLVYVILALSLSALGYVYVSKSLGWPGLFLSACLTVYLVYQTMLGASKGSEFSGDNL